MQIERGAGAERVDKEGRRKQNELRLSKSTEIKRAYVSIGDFSKWALVIIAVEQGSRNRSKEH